MFSKSFSEVTARTLDYLARKYPWVGAVLRNRFAAALVFIGYVGFVIGTAILVHDGAANGWQEIAKSYSPLFFDLLVVFLFTVFFLLIRGYNIEKNSCIDKSISPDPEMFVRLSPSQVVVEFDESRFYRRNDAVSSILDAIPIDQSDFFLAHAGSLDIPKITLLSVSLDDQGKILLKCGVGAFREFFYTHHFADYPISRSTSKDCGGKETLRELFSPVYLRSYSGFFKGVDKNLELLSYTPNTLGVTGCVRLLCSGEELFFFRRRGYHESADRNYMQLSYAGTLNVFPAYAGRRGDVTIELLADDEFQDEFMKAEPGLIISRSEPDAVVDHQLVGICANSQFLFQPELFVLTTISVNKCELVEVLRNAFAPGKNKNFWAVDSLDSVPGHLKFNKINLRPLCSVALNKIFIPNISG